MLLKTEQLYEACSQRDVNMFKDEQPKFSCIFSFSSYAVVLEESNFSNSMTISQWMLRLNTDREERWIVGFNIHVSKENLKLPSAAVQPSVVDTLFRGNIIAYKSLTKR